MPKNLPELLGSRLKQKNFTSSQYLFFMELNQRNLLNSCSSKDDRLIYFNSIPGVIEQLNIKHDVNKWRPFIDSFKRNLKTVLHRDCNVTQSTIPDQQSGKVVGEALI